MRGSKGHLIISRKISGFLTSINIDGGLATPIPSGSVRQSLYPGPVIMLGCGLINEKREDKRL